MSSNPNGSSSGFSRTNFSQHTLYEFMRNMESAGGCVSVHPMHRTPAWTGPVRPMSFPSSGGNQPKTMLQRLASESVGPSQPLQTSKRSAVSSREATGGKASFKPLDRGRQGSSVLVDSTNKSSTKRTRDVISIPSSKPSTPAKKKESGNPPPMFGDGNKERRGTRLNHVKGSSPQQLLKLRGVSSGMTGMDPTGVRRLMPAAILSLDDLHRAVLSIGFENVKAWVRTSSFDSDEQMAIVQYDSLQEYKSRQSQVLLVETMEGLKQSLSSGYSFGESGQASSSASSKKQMYKTVNVTVTTAVRHGRDWCHLTLKKAVEDAQSDNLVQGDIVLLLKPQSAALASLLQYGFTSSMSPDVLLEKGQALLGVVQRNKTNLVCSKEAKSVQLKCCLASKDAPLGYSPSDGAAVGSEWIGVVIHSVLTVEREWKALCALPLDAWYTKVILGDRSAHVDQAKSVSVVSGSVGGLNQFQREAIGAANNTAGSPVVIVQGPPGTGKTFMLVSLLEALKSRTKKVLVAAPSNAAVDELMRRFVSSPSLSSGDRSRVLRLGRQTANTSPELREYSLDQQVMDSQSQVESKRYEAYKTQKNKIFEDIKKVSDELSGGGITGGRKAELFRIKDRLKEQLDTLKSREQESVKIHRDSIYKQFFSRSQFVFGTLSAFGSDVVVDNLEGPIDVCVIDEAAQAIEPASLIPLRFSPKKLVLVGDPQQLSAVVKSSAAKKARFDLSLMERLQMTGNHHTHLLCEQYRMDPGVVEFPSWFFYDSRLVTGDSVFARMQASTVAQGIGRLFPKPVVFIDVSSSGDIKQGTSIINPREARVAADLVRFAHDKTGVSSIGVISPYKQQVLLLRSLLANEKHIAGLEVDSVDAFQGREKDVIVLSCVRSGGCDDSNSIGFLADQRRLNVAITRARHAVWVIGNMAYLRANGGALWNGLIDYCAEGGTIIEVGAVEDVMDSAMTDEKKLRYSR